MGTSPRHAERPPGPQACRQFAPQCASPLNEKRLVNGFMADAHGFIMGEVDGKPASDLFWAPGPRPPTVFPSPMSAAFPRHGRACNLFAARSDDDTSEPLLHIASQCRVGREPCSLGAAGRSLGMPLRCCRAVLETAAPSGSVAPQFP